MKNHITATTMVARIHGHLAKEILHIRHNHGQRSQPVPQIIQSEQSFASGTGAVSVTQIEIMPKPPVGYNPATPWPQWPAVFKTTSSHEEGCTRRWCLASNQFLGKNGKVTGVEVEEVEWIPAADGGRPTMKPTGKKEVIEADMVLLAMGFLKPEQPKFAKNVFLAGDAETGASLVVRAMAGGRKAAAEIDAYLIQ